MNEQTWYGHTLWSPSDQRQQQISPVSPLLAKKSILEIKLVISKNVFKSDKQVHRCLTHTFKH